MKPRTPEIRKLLANLPLFNALEADEIERLVLSTSELSFARGAIVFHRGDPCAGFHAVVRGRVKLAFVSPDGIEKVVRIIGPGQSFGEALMFMEKAYIVSAQALAESVLLYVPKSVVFAELERRPDFARKMLAGMSRRLFSLMSDVEAYSLHSGSQRVIGYLLKGEALNSGDEICLDVSKAVIASRLNLTPEHFSRILRSLSEEGLIKVGGRKITVLDSARLRDYGG